MTTPIDEKNKKNTVPTANDSNNFIDTVQNSWEIKENILKDNFIQVKTTKWFIGQYKIDPVTLIGHTIGLILWLLIWFYILQMHKNKSIVTKVFFWFSIVFWLRQIHARRNEKLTSILDELRTLDKLKDSIMGLLTAMIILVVFSYQNITGFNKKILGLAILIMSIAFTRLNFEDESTTIRKIRNFQQVTFNLGSLVLMIFIINMFFLTNQI